MLVFVYVDNSGDGYCTLKQRRDEMKNWADITKNLTLLTQLGLSFITPLLVCLGICWWLYSHIGLGGWIFIPGFFFGMGSSGMVAYKFYLSITASNKKEEKKNKTSFNRHS